MILLQTLTLILFTYIFYKNVIIIKTLLKAKTTFKKINGWSSLLFNFFK